MKKITLLIPLFALLFLVGCGAKKEVIQKPVEPTEEKQLIVQPKEAEKTIPEEKTKQIPKDILKEDKKEEHPHDGTEEKDHDDKKDSGNGHGDIEKLFNTLNFSTDKKQSIDGYSIEIKHKDVHAGDKLTRTVSIQKGGKNIDGLESIDGDKGVGITKDPVNHTEHLHPVVNTKNTLTFSSHTHDKGIYQVITQFKHDGKIITIPYQVNILEGDDTHGHE